ncbi:MAG: hypothetical protein AAFX78_18475, partial [Cyanobacteria bacterium J06638_20]
CCWRLNKLDRVQPAAKQNCQRGSTQTRLAIVQTLNSDRTSEPPKCDRTSHLTRELGGDRSPHPTRKSGGDRTYLPMRNSGRRSLMACRTIWSLS